MSTLKEVKRDEEFLARVIRAPWIASPSNQEPSKLLRRNRDAIGFLLDRKDPTKLDSMKGWIDYMSTYQNLDIFGYILRDTVIVIDGTVYSCEREGLSSIYMVKYFKIPGTMPYLFRATPYGYDYLLPINMRVDSLHDFLEHKYNLLLDADTGSDQEPVDSLFETLGIGKIMNDHLIQQAVQLLRDRIQDYEVMMRLEVITDITNNTQTVVAVPDDKYRLPIDVASNIVTQIFGEASSYDEVRRFFAYLPSYPEIVSTMKRVDQYSLPEVRLVDVGFISITSHYELGLSSYLDILCGSSSRGYIDELKNSGRKDYLNFFIEHLSKEAPYVRYGMFTLGIDMKVDIDFSKYQQLYDHAAECHNESVSHDRLEVYTNHDDQMRDIYCRYDLRTQRMNREQDIILSRISRILSKVKHRESELRSPFLDIGSTQWVVYNSSYDIAILAPSYPLSGVEPGAKRKLLVDIIDEWAAEEGLPGIKGMVQYFTEMKDDYVMPGRLRPIDTISTHISIHGILFRSSEIAKLFCNTPIAGAAQVVSEYNPPWLSYRDVKLIADFLNGLIMPYTYYTEMSNEAHIHLSDKDTFFYLYSYKFELDRGFALGEKLVDQMSRFKMTDEYEDISDKTKTLLSLF